MRDRVCIITGATAGIGLAVARELANRGAILVLIAHNGHEVSKCVDALRSETGNEAIDGVAADLSLISDVRRAARDFERRYSSLHVLVNNAGALFPQRTVTLEGLECNLALNHLAYFALTNTLLDVLKASAPSRIINVSSIVHRFGRLDFADLQSTYGYDRWRAYAQAKLANVLFTYELARRLEGTGVTANTLHPGFVATEFAANSTQLLDRFLRWIMPVAAVHASRAAETIIHLATSPDLQHTSGKYFVGTRASRSSRLSYDARLAAELWSESDALCQEYILQNKQ